LNSFGLTPRRCALLLTAISDVQVPAATFVLDSAALAFDTIKLTIVYAFIVFIDNDLPLRIFNLFFLCVKTY
jgi:hypothetical protein